VTEQKHEGAQSTGYLLKGELPEVLKGVERIFTEYDPRAYGTNVSKIEHDGQQFVAKVVHFNSAD
jgi:hypothetical protein